MVKLNDYFLYRDIFIYIFAAVEGIEQDVCGTAKHYDITEAEAAKSVCHHALQRDKDTATANHGHKGTRSDRGIFTQALNGHIEYAAPHHGGA